MTNRIRTTLTEVQITPQGVITREPTPRLLDLTIQEEDLISLLTPVVEEAAISDE